MRIDFTRTAIKELKKIGPARANIVTKIRQYADDPASLANNVRALSKSDEYRLRIGDYRVLFVLSDDTMTVVAVRHRSRAYD